MNSYDDLDDFLGGIPGCVALREALLMKDILEVFTREKIESVLPDRDPFLVLEKASWFRDCNETDCVLSSARISEKQCEGHIPEQLMVPAIIFSRGLALTGRLLSACVTEREKIVAEFVQAGEVKSLLGLGDLHYTKPPADVIFLARKVSQEKRSIVCDTRAWIVTSDGFVPAVSIVGMQYAIIPKRIFIRSLQGPKEKRELATT